MSHMHASEWHRTFKEGWEDVEDERPGCSSTAKTVKMLKNNGRNGEHH